MTQQQLDPADRPVIRISQAEWLEYGRLKSVELEYQEYKRAVRPLIYREEKAYHPDRERS